jgi:hypothetical protein
LKNSLPPTPSPVFEESKRKIEEYKKIGWEESFEKLKKIDPIYSETLTKNNFVSKKNFYF